MLGGEGLFGINSSALLRPQTMHQTNCAINLAYQSLAINLRYTRLACLCPCPFQSHYYSRCQKSLYVYKRTLQKKGRSEFRGDAFVTLVTLDWTPAIIGVAARRADHSSASWNSRSRTAATGGITLLSSGTGPPASPRLLPVADCFYRRHNKNNQLITRESRTRRLGVAIHAPASVEQKNLIYNISFICFFIFSSPTPPPTVPDCPT